MKQISSILPIQFYIYILYIYILTTTYNIITINITKIQNITVSPKVLFGLFPVHPCFSVAQATK